MSETARARVIASISGELGRDGIEVLPAGIELKLSPGVSDDRAAEDAISKARSLLKKKRRSPDLGKSGVDAGNETPAGPPVRIRRTHA